MTSTGNAVGMEAREAGRNAQKDPRIEARERLEARPWTPACTALLKTIATDANFAEWTTNPTLPEFLQSAADALSEAEGELDRMREALEPFAKAADAVEGDYGNARPNHQYQFPQVTMGDLRAAQAALSPTRRDGE